MHGIIVRFLVAGLGFGSTIYIAWRFSPDVAALIFYFQFVAQASSGWCALSYRQKLLAEYRVSQKAAYGKRGRYIWISIVVALAVAMLVPRFTKEFSDVGWSWMLFASLLASHISSGLYAKFWDQQSLTKSYAVEAITPLALLVAATATFTAQGFVLLYTGLTLVTCGILFVKNGMLSFFAALPFTRDTIFAWLSAQLIATVGVFEVFVLPAVGMGENVVLFKIANSSAMALTLIASFYRQRMIGRSDELEGVYLKRCGWLTILVMAICVGSLTIVGKNLSAAILVALAFVACCYIQVHNSFLAYQAYKEGKSWVVLLVAGLTLVLMSGLISLLPISNYVDLLKVKIAIVSINVAVLYICFRILLSSRVLRSTAGI